jgi:Fe-S-cluster containining protein
MPRRKLPLLAERSLAQLKAERIELTVEFDASRPTVSCTAGCSACCSYPMFVSILEGIHLFRYLTERGYWTPSFRRSLEDHASKTFDLAAEVWLTINLPCPLLEKNRCIAYSARPFSCRTLYARSDPKACHPHRMVGAVFVNREAITAKFREAEGKILARHRLALVGLPVSKAILIAEKIENGEADLEQFLSIVVESLREVTP